MNKKQEMIFTQDDPYVTDLVRDEQESFFVALANLILAVLIAIGALVIYMAFASDASADDAIDFYPTGNGELDNYREYTYPFWEHGEDLAPQPVPLIGNPFIAPAPDGPPNVGGDGFSANDPLNFPSPNGGVLGDSVVERPPGAASPVITSYVTGEVLPLIYGDYYAEQLWYDQVAGACNHEGLFHYEQCRVAILAERAKCAAGE